MSARVDIWAFDYLLVVESESSSSRDQSFEVDGKPSIRYLHHHSIAVIQAWIFHFQSAFAGSGRGHCHLTLALERADSFGFLRYLRDPSRSGRRSFSLCFLT